MSKIDFRAKYGSAGSKEVYFARIKNALGLNQKTDEVSEFDDEEDFTDLVY